MTDKDYMLRAIELAKKGLGFVNPNPMVGAVIVKDNRIIGEGYHQRYGELHAERNAIKNLTESAEGATIYVTLEPCCHYGKNPPCTEALIEHKLAKVVVGSFDPNPLVAGKGIKQLRDAGIEVVENFMRQECDAINDVFFHYITTKTPYLVMKYAMTLDGKIATRTGASKWVTSQASRDDVQLQRHRYAGILVGIGTVLADDPLLTTRDSSLSCPVRIVLDSRLRTPLDSQLVKTAMEHRTIIAYSDKSKEVTARKLSSMGVECYYLPSETGQVDIKALMAKLGELKIDSVLVEGGATVNEAFIKSGYPNRLEVYLAPKIFGGIDAKSPVGGLGVELPAEAPLFKLKEIKQIGDDIRLSYTKE